MSTLTCSICRSFCTAAACSSGEIGGTDHAVNHGLEGIRRQSVQIQEVLLTDIPQESGDLGVIHHARQRDALSGGEDQRVEPHGHHRLHPGKRADDGPGAASIIQKIVGDVQPCRGQSPGNRVQMLFHGGEHRRQTVGLVGVFRRLCEQRGLVLKALPFRRAKHRYFPWVGMPARSRTLSISSSLAAGGSGPGPPSGGSPVSSRPWTAIPSGSPAPGG